MTEGRRLESWKEIAGYLSRSERTVRRWEASEGLPIHRLQHDKRGSVYAYTTELDAWRASRSQRLIDDAREAASTGLAPAIVVAKRRSSVAWIAAPMIVSVTVGALILAPGPNIPSARPGGTSNLEAQRAFRQAFFAHNAGRVQIQTGVQYLQQAIRLDPQFADAWAGLATAHVAQTWFGDLSARQTLAAARREAEHALRLDRTHAGARRVLAAVHHFLDWDHAAAERLFLDAAERHPSSPVTWSWLAECLLNLGRFDDALARARRANDADPRWLETIMVSGNIHAFSGHVDLAVAEYQRALAIEPNFGLGHHFLGRALLLKGDYPRAIEHLRKSNELLGQVPFSQADLAYALAMSGSRVEAKEMLIEFERRYEQGSMPAFAIATVNAGLGRFDAALDWLERAAAERHVGYYFPSVDPIYAPLRTNARFHAILRTMNLASL